MIYMIQSSKVSTSPGAELKHYLLANQGKEESAKRELYIKKITCTAAQLASVLHHLHVGFWAVLEGLRLKGEQMCSGSPPPKLPKLSSSAGRCQLCYLQEIGAYQCLSAPSQGAPANCCSRDKARLKGEWKLHPGFQQSSLWLCYQLCGLVCNELLNA